MNTPFGHLNTPKCHLNTPWGSKVNTPYSGEITAEDSAISKPSLCFKANPKCDTLFSEKEANSSAVIKNTNSVPFLFSYLLFCSSNVFAA